jgi:hypothetical protein
MFIQAWQMLSPENTETQGDWQTDGVVPRSRLAELCNGRGHPQGSVALLG